MSESRMNGLVATVGVLAAVLGLVVGGLSVFFFGPARQSTDDFMNTDGPVCTLIGADAGVHVDLSKAPIKAGSEVSVTVKDDTDTVITARTIVPDEDAKYFGISLPIDYGENIDLTITVTFVGADGTEKTVTTTTHSVLVEPNGPECEPHVHQVNLHLVGEELLPATDN